MRTTGKQVARVRKRELNWVRIVKSKEDATIMEIVTINCSFYPFLKNMNGTLACPCPIIFLRFRSAFQSSLPITKGAKT